MFTIKNYKLSIIAVMVILTTFTTSCGEKKAKEEVETVAPKVAVVEASGKVKAGDTINLSLDYQAFIESINVKQGQTVKRGDVLFTIDNSAILNEIAKLENDLASQRANLQKQQSSLSGSNETVKNQISAEEADLARLKDDKNAMEKNYISKIGNLKSEVNLAQKNLSSAQADFNARQVLFNNGGISKSELDQYEITLKTKQNSMQSANSALESAQVSHEQEMASQSSLIVQSQTRLSNYRIELSNPKTVTANDIEMTRKQIANIELSINDLKAKTSKPYLNGNQIICPVDQAVVLELISKIGDSTAGNVKLAALIDNANLFVEAEVDEESANEVKIGANVVIKPVSNNTKQYHGKVVRIADLGIERNGSTVILTEISIDDRDQGIQSGFNVDVEIAKE